MEGWGGTQVPPQCRLPVLPRWLAQTGSGVEGALLWIERLATGQHGDELLDPTRPGFRALGAVHPIYHREAVLAGQDLEHCPRLRCRGQRCVEVGWHLLACLAGVRRVPPSVRLRSLNLPQASR